MKLIVFIIIGKRIVLNIIWSDFSIQYSNLSSNIISEHELDEFKTDFLLIKKEENIQKFSQYHNFVQKFYSEILFLKIKFSY